MSGHIVGKSCSFDLPNVYYVYLKFWAFPIIDYECDNLVVIAPVPGHYIPSYFFITRLNKLTHKK